MIEICTVSGYDEVGRNMTAIKVDNEVILLDMGIHLDNYIKYTQDDDYFDATKSEMIKAGAIPDDGVISDWKQNVVAIIPSHAHLDHVGAVAYMCNSYNAPIICTPYTEAVLSSLAKERDIKIRNHIKVLHSNSSIDITKSIKIEFIHITHSIPQTAMVVIHTKYGVIVYLNDFKLDNHPIIGKSPNIKSIQSLREKNVRLLIMESLRAEQAGRTPSEFIAREMLKDVLLGCDKREGIIVTTFSSHIARLKTIIECGRLMKRKVVLLGRSLGKYVDAAERIKLVNFSGSAEIVHYSKNIRKRLKQIDEEGRSKYLLVVTGHQGEPNSTLSKMVNRTFQFKLYPEDNLVFSCTIIPSPVNIENRRILEEKLRTFGIRIYRDVHVSGHASREDLRDMINWLKPKHIIPSHGGHDITTGLVSLAKEMGYTLGDDVHLMRNGERMKIL